MVKVRDEDYINNTLEFIAKFWNNSPELRLMQLLLNADRNANYYTEDEALLEKLKEYDEKFGKS